MAKTFDRIRVYVAAPYTLGDVGANVHRCVKLCDALWAAGFLPICPLLTHLWHVISPKSYDEWLEYDSYFLHDADVMLFDAGRTPGPSNGVRQELLQAERDGIPVYWSVESLYRDFPEGKVTA